MLTCLYEGQRIYIGEYIDFPLLRELGRNSKLLCPDPDCLKPVLLHYGKFKTPHFAHRKGDGLNCHFGISESEEHEEGKRYIYNLLRSMYKTNQVWLEETLESGQKADVLLEIEGKRIAFEIQFSEQDGATWESRSQKYSDIGVVPIWILGYKKPLHEMVEHRMYFTSARIKLGRTREYAVQNAKLVQELIDRFTDGSTYIKHPWESVEKYQVVHILTLEEGVPELSLGYVSQKSTTIWDGYCLPIGEDSAFDPNQGRFIPRDEVIAQRAAESKFNEWTEWRDKVSRVQEELRKKVLIYTKAERIEWLPIVLANDEIFYGRKRHEVYDILLLEVALYLKIIRLHSFYDDTIAEIFINWGFEWKDYRNLFVYGEIGEFFTQLVENKILDRENGKWKIVGKLTTDKFV